MKLIHKIFFGLIVIIIFIGLSNLVSITFLLNNLQEKRLQTSEVILAKSMAKRMFREVLERKIESLTFMLFEELSLREEKLEYIKVCDGKDAIAHTFLEEMPPELVDQGHGTKGAAGYYINKINTPRIKVYDISVPINTLLSPQSYLWSAW